MLIRENIPQGRKLNPRIKTRWFLERFVIFLPLFVAIAVLLYLIGFTQGEINPAYIAVFAMLAVLLLAAAYAEVELRYRKFVYALRERDFLIQKGIVEKIRYVIPYEKIQNVTVSRDFIEVALGLGTVHIETAAHVYVENDIVLPGISNDSNLVNELVARSKLAKEGGQKALDYPEAMTEMMKEVVVELREIRKALRKEPPEEPHPLKHQETLAISEQLKGTKVLYEKTARKKREP